MNAGPPGGEARLEKLAGVGVQGGVEPVSRGDKGPFIVRGPPGRRQAQGVLPLVEQIAQAQGVGQQQEAGVEGFGQAENDEPVAQVGLGPGQSLLGPVVRVQTGNDPGHEIRALVPQQMVAARDVLRQTDILVVEHGVQVLPRPGTQESILGNHAGDGFAQKR